MPIYSPTGFLDITNATLRTSNLEAQNFKLNGGNIYVTSELTTDELLNLDNVVNAGNATSNTVQFTNTTTGFVVDSNIVVTGNVTAGSFLGDGSGLTSIPPSAITGTLSQWSDGTNSDVYIASNVGIGNVHTLTSNTLQVGANLYVRDADANVLTVTGNVAADYFEGDGSKLTGISSTLQAITDSGNVTSNTVQFSNATTGFVTTSNIEVGGALKINTITAAAYHALSAVTAVGASTGDTIQLTNATTGLVTTANVDVGGDMNVTGNLTVLGTRTIVDTDTLRVKDPIIELGKDNPGTGDLGLVMTRPSGSSNVAMIFDESTDTLEIGYTQSNASDTDITMRTAATEPLDVSVNGNVSVGKELTVTGDVEVGTANLFVDTVNSRVGIGTTSPAAQLEIHGIGQTSETTFDQTGSMGGVLALRSDDGSAGSGGAVMFGSHAGFHAAIKASLEDGSTNTRGRLAFFTRSNTTDATMSHAMTIADGGNVGIGTTNPGAPLDVFAPVASGTQRTALRLTTPESTTGTGCNLDFIQDTANVGRIASVYEAGGQLGMSFSTWNSGLGERVRIDASGNVGIGTTNPGALLHVNGDIAVGANGSLRRTADNDLINIYAGSDSTSPYMFMTGKSRSSNANKIGFRIASATKFELYSDKAYFADNVGIGTTDPKTRLHVNHDLHLQSSSEAWSTTAGKGLYLRYSTTGGQNAAYIQSIDRSNTSLSYPMIFQGSSYQFSVGNVGIGTNTPLGRLHVQTETRSGTEGSGNGIYVTSGCAEYSNGSEFRHSNQSQGVGIGYAGIYATGSNTNQDLSIVSRGTGTTYVKNYAVFSDDRIKTNEEYIMNATETLMKLKPQVYDKHEEINVLSDNPKREAGLIAQDIYYDTPELRYIVSTRNRGIDAEPVNIPSEKPFVDDDPQKDPDYSGWGTASAGVAYIQLVPYLIRSNQEIYTELQAEKARNDSLEARILALENAS